MMSPGQALVTPLPPEARDPSARGLPPGNWSVCLCLHPCRGAGAKLVVAGFQRLPFRGYGCGREICILRDKGGVCRFLEKSRRRSKLPLVPVGCWFGQRPLQGCLFGHYSCQWSRQSWHQIAAGPTGERFLYFGAPGDFSLPRLETSWGSEEHKQELSPRREFFLSVWSYLAPNTR